MAFREIGPTNRSTQGYTGLSITTESVQMQEVAVDLEAIPGRAEAVVTANDIPFRVSEEEYYQVPSSAFAPPISAALKKALRRRTYFSLLQLLCLLLLGFGPIGLVLLLVLWTNIGLYVALQAIGVIALLLVTVTALIQLNRDPLWAVRSAPGRKLDKSRLVCGDVIVLITTKLFDGVPSTGWESVWLIERVRTEQAIDHFHSPKTTKHEGLFFPTKTTKTTNYSRVLPKVHLWEGIEAMMPKRTVVIGLWRTRSIHGKR